MQLSIIVLLFSFLASLGHSAPQYAAIVMDAHSGKILESINAHTPCPPASLTKKMTLYLAFEALKNGSVSLATKVPISQRAASQEPSNLGLKSGERVSFEALIMSMVTRSANDGTTAIAEFLGGSVERFARIMNAKARKLGMQNTVFRNASGLPNSEQLTTAHDMALLGSALYRDFPKQYYRFSAQYFRYKGQLILSHNKLLGKVLGVDGIKTGYTKASGFNLTASAERNGRRLIVVVMGGPNRHWRDKHVTELFEKHFSLLSNQRMQDTEDTSEMDHILNDKERDMDDLVDEIIDTHPQEAIQHKPVILLREQIRPLKKELILKKKKEKKAVQVGPYNSKLQATLVAQRIAKNNGGKIVVKKFKRVYLAQVQELTTEASHNVCQSLKKQRKACQILKVS